MFWRSNSNSKITNGLRDRPSDSEHASRHLNMQGHLHVEDRYFALVRTTATGEAAPTVLKSQRINSSWLYQFLGAKADEI